MAGRSTSPPKKGGLQPSGGSVPSFSTASPSVANPRPTTVPTVIRTDPIEAEPASSGDGITEPRMSIKKVWNQFDVVCSFASGNEELILSSFEEQGWYSGRFWDSHIVTIHSLIPIFGKLDFYLHLRTPFDLIIRSRKSKRWLPWSTPRKTELWILKR